MARMALNERDFFVEKTEIRKTPIVCPKCGHREAYSLKWIRRTKKDRVPPGGDERDHALFKKLTDYLIRVDDHITCARCRRRVEIPSHQSVSALSREELGLPKDEETCE